jgi:hypothetical protein
VLDEESGGVGLVLATNNALTNVTWSFQGSTFDNVTDSDEDPQNPGKSSGCDRIDISQSWTYFAAVGLIGAFKLLLFLI